MSIEYEIGDMVMVNPEYIDMPFYREGKFQIIGKLLLDLHLRCIKTNSLFYLSKHCLVRTTNYNIYLKSLKFKRLMEMKTIHIEDSWSW